MAGSSRHHTKANFPILIAGAFAIACTTSLFGPYFFLPGFAVMYGMLVTGALWGKPTWGMFALGEMAPRSENRVSLDPAKKDAWGIPAARIECGHSEDEVKMVAHMRRRLPEIATAGGLHVDTNLDLGRTATEARFLRPQLSGPQARIRLPRQLIAPGSSPAD